MNSLPTNGKPTVFATGAKRDMQENKGRVDLIPLDLISDIMEIEYSSEVRYMDIYRHIKYFLYEGDERDILLAIHMFANLHYGDLYTAFLEVGHRYEAGAIKYGDRNWESGVPLRVYVNSSVRHLLKVQRGDNDEDHAGAVLWNLINLVETYRKFHLNEYINDLPFSLTLDEVDLEIEEYQ